MTRIIVHPGYHKTGTTSLQSFLITNRATLTPCFDFYGKADFPAAGAHARRYASQRFPWTLWQFRRAFRRFLAPLGHDRNIVISRETFSGAMPGHRDVYGRMFESYGPAARPLANTIVAELRRKFGPEAEITFVYTTRDAEPWIASVHGHLLRSIKLTDDFAMFRQRLSPLRGPEQEAEAMRRHLDPLPVVSVPLETYSGRQFGAAEVILDLMQVPPDVRARLCPVQRANAGQKPELRAAFLELNRSKMDKKSLRETKKALLQAHGKRP